MAVGVTHFWKKDIRIGSVKNDIGAALSALDIHELIFWVASLIRIRRRNKHVVIILGSLKS